MRKTCDKDAQKCEFMHVHEEILEKVKSVMPEDEILYELAELYNTNVLSGVDLPVF